jgi:hypothetical protein
LFLPVADCLSSGTIDAYELDKVFKYMGQGVTEDALDNIMAEMDGEIRFGEFLAVRLLPLFVVLTSSDHGRANLPLQETSFHQ